MKLFVSPFVLCVVVVSLLSSCLNYRYINKNNEIPANVFELYSINKFDDYKLQPYDYLYIDIKSTNKDVDELYRRISASSAGVGGNNMSSSFLTGYLISDSGYVFVPTLGAIKVKGLTINEARNLIKEKVSEILIDAVVNVRLMSFNISFIGEINSQGRLSFQQERVNLLDAISTAGGLTYYADKKKIKIVRKQDTVFKVYEVDISNANILTSKDFFLQPNDIVYIPPRRQKEIIDFFRDYSYFVTIFTSTITTTFLVIELTKKSKPGGQ